MTRMSFSAASLLSPVIALFVWWSDQIANVWNSLHGVWFVGGTIGALFLGWKKSEFIEWKKPGEPDNKKAVGFDGAPHAGLVNTPVWVRVMSAAISGLMFMLFMYAAHFYLGLF